MMNRGKKSVTLKIAGMHCANCALTIEKSLKSLSGVEEASVSLASAKAFVVFDPYSVDLGELEKVIASAGYKVVYERATLYVLGISDSSDAKAIEGALSKVEGIKSVSVNTVGGKVSVEYNPAQVSLSDIRQKLSSLGYQVVEEELAESVEDVEAKRVKLLAALGMVLSVPIILYSYPEIFAFLPLSGTAIAGYMLAALASIVQFGVGMRYYSGALRAARAKTANMDTLVSLGTSAAYVYSLFAVIPTPRWEQVYFDSAAVVLALVTVGKYFEARMRGRATNVVKKLLELVPRQARVLRGGVEVEVPSEMIREGDIVIVKPGERIPVDGVVVEGHSAVDESVVTGESVPVEKRVGDELIGGSINREGLLKIKATRIGEESFISQMARLVEETLGKKPSIQRVVDRIAGRFTFMVIAVALLTFFTWNYVLGAGLAKALISSVAILVVACPCALGIATPLAISTGVGKMSNSGVLVKNSDAIEKMGKLKVVVFDKTGTLTKGEPEVVEVVAYPQVVVKVSGAANGEVMQPSDVLLSYAASAEKGSEHPLAAAIVRAVNSRGLEVYEPEDFYSYPGRGVIARIAGHKVVIGKPSFVSEVTGKEVDSKEIERLASQGRTVVVAAIDGEIAGLIALMDRPRENAVKAIRRIKEMGIDVAMITGDNEATAKAIAAELGIERVLANVPPEAKAKEIEKLQASGLVVGMVGDGVNDAAALSQADIGFAIGSGTEIAVEAGDIVLLRNDPLDVVIAVELGRRTLRQVKQNLFWAFAYNVALIPIAAMGLLYPVYAGLAMALSSISVTSWSLTLKRYKPKVVAG